MFNNILFATWITLARLKKILKMKFEFSFIDKKEGTIKDDIL